MKVSSGSVIKLSLVFFTCLLAFSIGTFVGKKLSDNQYRLSQLETNESAGGEVASAHEAAVETPTAATGEKEVATDDEIAKLAEEFVADDVGPKEVAMEGVPSAAGEIGKATVGGARKPTAVSIEKPVAVEKVAEAKHVAAPNVQQTHYTIQIASFPNEADATKRSEEIIKDKDSLPAFVSKVQIQGKTWYRVNVGMYSTEKEAQETLKKDKKVAKGIIQKISATN